MRRPHLILTSVTVAALDAAQRVRERESALSEREASLKAAEAQAVEWQRKLGEQQRKVEAGLAEAAAAQAAAKGTSETAARERRSSEAARRALGGVEAALEEREAALHGLWDKVVAHAAALKDGNMEALQEQGQQHKATMRVRGRGCWLVLGSCTHLQQIALNYQVSSIRLGAQTSSRHRVSAAGYSCCLSKLHGVHHCSGWLTKCPPH